MVDQTFPSAWLRHQDGLRTEIAGICTIGRSSTNHVVLPHPKISRQHAIIHEQGANEYWLVDLESSNGTFLNGGRVTDPVRVRNQDSIQIGHFWLNFRQASTADKHETDESNLRSTAKDIQEATAWLLVADIRAFTSLNRQRSPIQVATEISDWFDACTKLIEEQGGTLDKYLGDGFLAYWIDDDGSEERVSGALDALQVFQEDSALPFRVAVHYGIVCLGYLPTMGRARLFGTEVNFTFRMEYLAKQLGMSRLISQAAIQRLKEFLLAKPVGRHELAGFDGAFSFYEF